MCDSDGLKRGVNLKKILKSILFIIVVVPVLLVVSTPLVNDYIASSIKKDLKELSLPAKTVIVDAVSSAGKLVGNGNGMQYFGAILIKSELNLNALKEFYSTYPESKWSYIVEKQVGDQIEFIDHNDLKFKALDK